MAAKVQEGVRVRLDLDRFVAAEYPKVVGAVGLITGDRQNAPDAVQDAIVRLLSTPHRQEILNVSAWLTVVASNQVRDSYRRRGAEKRALAKIAVPREGIEDAAALLDIDVQAALAKLPQQQRQVIVLHYLLDQSVETIAEGVGVSAGTVKTHLHRARKTLATLLRKEDHHD